MELRGGESRGEREDEAHVVGMLRGWAEVDADVGSAAPFIRLSSLLHVATEDVGWAAEVVPVS